MNMEYWKLGIASLLPVIASVVIYLLDRVTLINRVKNWQKQIVIGIIFGALAVIGTEWGIDMNGARVNCRDGAVLVAGLMFGGPAGIIAGIIGGVERWIAVAWGVGSFTRVACSISTIIAGIYAALLRHYIFERKRPSWPLAFVVGVVMETVHMTLVFLTNLSEPQAAFSVIRACTLPMMIANGAAVMLSAVLISLVRREYIGIKLTKTYISMTIQRWLFVTVAIAFAATTIFLFFFQNGVSDNDTERLLTMALEETAADIRYASDSNMEAVLNTMDQRIINVQGETWWLGKIADDYNVAEINLIDEKGIIVSSSNDEFVGFDMKSGTQSSEFLCLLYGTDVFIQDYGPISYNSSISRKYAGKATDYGILQIGYDAEHFLKDISANLRQSTAFRHIGENGFVLVLDQENKVLCGTQEFVQAKLPIDTEALLAAQEDEVFEMKINDEKYECQFRNIEGCSVISFLPHSEAYRMRDVSIYVNTFLEIIVFATLFGLVFMLIRRTVVDQIGSVNKSLSNITAGNLDEVVNVRSSIEFSSLSDDINATVGTLKNYIDEANARIDRELEFAKEIQASALPRSFPAFPRHKEFDIYAIMDPAKEVGGDFYDLYMTRSNILNFVIADVSGKGIPAAMFMMRAKTELKTLTESDVVRIDDVFTRSNTALCEGNDAGMFVTAWQGRVNLDSGHVNYVNAGHNPPLICHNGKYEYLRSRPGFVLAGMTGVKYRLQDFTLEPGDRVFLYTDGVTEATDSNEQLYGEERLLAVVNANADLPPQQLCEAVRRDVDAFVGDAPQFDDMTMLAFSFAGKEKMPEMRCDNISIDDIPKVTQFVEEELEKLGCPMKAVMALDIAIDEIYSNIVKFAYPGSSGYAIVTVEPGEDGHSVSLRFTDGGVPYNPMVKEDPDITLSAEERSIGGLGIFMVKKTMDRMYYCYEDEQNILTITKCY